MLRSLIVLGALGWFAACGVAVDAEELQTDCASDTEFCCPTGSKLCDSECVSRRNPKYGCDADACVPCLVDNATATCGANGSCRVAVCDPGFADCNEFDIDGCEVDLTSDPDNCRRCGVECDFVFPGHAIAEYPAGGSGPSAGCVDVVFQCDGNAVQRPPPPPVALLALERPRGRQRLVPGDRDERVQRRIVGVDTAQARFHELDRR
jgi:hypothetical protein